MTRLNHIGIAVDQLPALKKFFSILGLEIKHTEAVPEQGVVTHFVPLPQSPNEPTQLEFLEPTDPTGTVAQFLKKRGPGIHHLSFEVTQGSLDALCQTLRDSGFRLIYDQCRAGAHLMRINFVHPASAGGILIELMEKQSK